MKNTRLQECIDGIGIAGAVIGLALISFGGLLTATVALAVLGIPMVGMGLSLFTGRPQPDC